MNRENTLASNMRGISSNVNICRFIAALLVIICHAYPLTQNKNDLLYSYTNGQCNWGGMAIVVLFFFSGLYVTKSMMKRSNVGEYMKARCIRIFPPLILTVLLCVFVLGPIVTTLSVGEYFATPATYLYMLNGIMLPVHNLPGVFTNSIYAATVNGPLWTMPIEFACYVALLIFYKIYEKLGKKNWVLIAIAGVIGVGCCGLYFFVTSYMPGATILVSAIRPTIAFFMGVAYFVFKDRIVLDYRLGLLALVLVALAGMTPFFSVALVLLLPYAVTSLTLGTKQICKNAKIFELSYEMYLVGWPIQQVLICVLQWTSTPWMNFLVTIPIDLAVSWVIFQISEKPLRK